MKKLFLLLSTLFIISSCSLDEDKPQYVMEFLPIQSVEYPEYLVPGETYQMKVKYIKPNGCYVFDRFHIEEDGNAILIAVQTMFRIDSECKKTENIIAEESFTFKCKEASADGEDTYVFKFYTGLDAKGNKTYFKLEYFFH